MSNVAECDLPYNSRDRHASANHDPPYIYVARYMPNTCSTAMFNNLFTEIIQSIFLHAYYDDRRSSLNAILPVCRQWKTIALATPELWTLISLSGADSMPADRALERVAEWTTRSTNVAVDVEIKRLNPETLIKEHQWSAELVDCLISILRPTSARWNSLRLVQSPTRLTTSFCHAMRESGVPKLQVLELDIKRLVGDEVQPYNLFNSSAPQLSIVRCPNLPLSLSFVECLDGLTTLELNRESFSMSSNVAAIEVTRALSALPTLEYLAVHGEGDGPMTSLPSDPDPSQPNTYPEHMTCDSLVEIYIDDSELMVFLFRLVRLPYVRHASKFHSISLINFQLLDGTFRLPRLETLHIDGIGDNSWNQRGLRCLPLVFQSQHWLTSLTFEKIHFRDDFSFKSLKGYGRLLRRLRILDCWMWSPTPLRELVEERTKSGRPPLLYFEVQRLQFHDLRAVAEVRGWLRTHVQVLRWY